MDIVNPHLSVTQFGDHFNLTVEYTATFVPAEAGFSFEDTIVFAERDSGDDFDFFSPDVRTPGGQFIPNSELHQFTPNGEISVFRRRERNGVSQSNLNTGPGDEDLVGLVHLRNVSLNGQNIRKRTNINVIDA